MTNHSTIRNRKNKPEEKVYPLVIRKELYQELQSTAYANDISVADFVRESVKRNLATYKKALLA